MIKLTYILLEGNIQLYEMYVLVKTDFDYNKVEIYNHIRALQGVVTMIIERNDFLRRQSKGKKFEYSLVKIKFFSKGSANEDINKIKEEAMKLPGMLQFIPRPKTLVQKSKY